MFRKTLCFILSLALIISAAPIAVLAADDVVIEFSNASMNDPYKKAPSDWTGIRDFKVVVDESTTGAGSRFTGNNIPEFENKKILQAETRAGSNRVWVQAVKKGEPYGAVLTIQASVPNAGWYGIKLLGGVSQYGSDYYIYVNDQYAGFYSFYTTDTSAFCLAGEEKTLNTLYLTPDENGKVKIKFCVAATHYGSARAYPYKLTLSPVSGDVSVSGIESTIPAKAEIGETVEVKSYIKMSDGTARYFNGYNVDASVNSENSMSVTVSGGDAVSVIGSSEDGVFSGKVSADSLGSAEITVNALLGNVPYNKVYPIEVTEAAQPKRFEIEMSRDTMTYADRSVPSSDWQTYGFDIVLDKTATYSCRYPKITVPSQEYGVLKPVQLQMRSGAYSVWYKQPLGSDYMRNNMFTIKKNVAAAGIYAISFIGFKWNAGSDFAIYVNGNYAGDYSCYDADSSNFSLGEEKRLNTLYLPKGDVEISFRSSKAYYNTPILLPYKLVFDPVGTDELAASGADFSIPNALYDNSEENASVKIKMNDGSTRHFGLADNASADANNTVSVTSDNTSVFEIKDVSYAQPETGDTVGFVIACKSTGTANVKVEGLVDGKAYSYQKSVTVTEPPKLSEVNVSFDKNPIPATRKAQASLSLKLTNGEDYTGAYSVVYESLAPSVAQVDSATGEVTGISVGEAEIKATVTAEDGTVKSGSTVITVSEKPYLKSVSLSAPAGGALIGRPVKVSVTGTASDGEEFDLSGCSVSYRSSDSEVASVDDDGNVTALKAGTAVITVSVAYGDEAPLSDNLVLTVLESIPTIEIDFTKTVAKADYSQPDDTPGYTILADKGNGSNYFRKFTYPDTKRTLLHVATRAPGTSTWPGSSDKQTTFTISADIPFESNYRVSLRGGMWYSGGVYSIFVDGKYVGDHSFYSKETILSEDDFEPLNSIHLTAGAHEIMFRVRKSVYHTPYALLDTLMFTPTESSIELQEIEADIPSRIAVGEVVSRNVRALTGDGSAYHFGVTDTGAVDTENTISVSVSGTGASVSDFGKYVIGETGEYPITITAVSEGSVSLEFKACVGGKTVTKTADIQIENDPLKEVRVRTEAEELFKNDSAKLVVSPILESGREISASSVTVSYESETPDIISVDGDTVTALAVGRGRIKATVEFNGVKKFGYVDIEVIPDGMTSIDATAGGSRYIRLTDIENDTVPLYVSAIDNLGRELDTSNAEISAEALTPEYADINEANIITPVSVGEAKFKVTVKLDGRIRTGEFTLHVVKGKSKATYMTAEKAAAARENMKKYDWAKSSINSQYITAADKYVGYIDALYDLIPSEGIPRSMTIGAEGDPDMYLCRYCGTDIRAEYGLYAWKHSPLTRPWKVQCPDCKRFFPSNDFGSFYKLGLNEYGEFDRTRALEAHARLFGDLSAPEGSDEYYGYGKGYLKNDLYPEVASVPTINGGAGLREGESVDTWGVDDGMGYVPKDKDGNPYKYSNGVTERHLYIAEYLHSGIWNKRSDNQGTVQEAIKRCAYAYFYTGDKKYGRCAAILLDRVADFYYQYDISLYGDDVWNSDGGSNKGKTIGRIWETGVAKALSTCYDMVFDMYDDEYVLNYIQNKSANIKMRHAKNTPSQIRTNIEDGLIRTVLDGLVDCSISGNFGYPQAANAVAAVVLDTMPETKQWLDFLLAPGWSTSAPCLGGGINEQLVNEVDHDGQGNEASSYNVDWHTMLMQIAEVLENYDGYTAADLYANPKFVKMFYSNIPLMSSGYTPQIGDTASTASKSHWIPLQQAKEGFRKLKDPVFAQILYELNGNSEKGLRYDVTVEDPERLEKEVKNVIDTYGTFNPSSEVMTGFGFAALRDGKNYSQSTATTATNTQRDVWMYFGANTGHGHTDTLNIGMTAFGLNFMPDLAYPETTGTQPNRLQWVSSTLSHNTVMVDEKQQDKESEVRGKIKHFDDDGTVGVMDVSTPYVYKSTDEYRRSLVTVKVDDSNTYTVDFFRVKGGDSHLYSVHASSNSIAETDGLKLVPQADAEGNYVGSYAGADVPFGKDPNSPEAWNYETVYPRGYTWLNNVDRAQNPNDSFAVDFEIRDFNRAIKDSSGLHLRMTMLDAENSGVNTEVAIADGYPPKRAENKNIDKLKYVLVKNEGSDLDSLFTAVYEPYRNNRYIAGIEEVSASAVDGSAQESDRVRAVKVTHTSGRVDYIVYSTNETVKYRIDDKFDFRGFVGVYSLNADGVNIYSYVNDGDIIGNIAADKSAITGYVTDFTREYTFENEVIISPDSAVSDEELQSLEGKLVYIDNGEKSRDAAYVIKSAERDGDKIKLSTGDVTFVRRYASSSNPDAGYIYNISVGQSAKIPLSASDNGAPIFETKADVTATAGSSMTTRVAASNYEGETITYALISAPTGATINSETGEITWKPDSSQIGDNHFAVTATDESGRESTLHFTVRVYGSTTPSGGGGAGGGGGGGTPTPTPDPEPNPNPEPTPDPTPGEDHGGFVDIDNYAWAKDSINALAKEGVIKGTSEDTFSPSSNITRADFAILLVRAFKLTGEGKENFADVAASDYFANELAIAKENGIVGGIGDNKYAPRNTITREDMMVIVYRALKKLGYELKGGEITAPDFESVSDYAKEAVSALVANGLVNGKNGLIDPKAYTTRAEVAVLVKRILDFTEKQ